MLVDKIFLQISTSCWRDLVRSCFKSWCHISHV